MGPRLLRSVRTQDEGTFVPYLALPVSILLAFGCVGMLVYFVGHMASRINVDTVIDLVGRDVRSAILRLTTQRPDAELADREDWDNAVAVPDTRRGYLQQVDQEALPRWAQDHETSIRLLIRLGAALCDMVGRYLPTGIWTHEGRTCPLVPGVDYDGLADAMFHTIRQDVLRRFDRFGATCAGRLL